MSADQPERLAASTRRIFESLSNERRARWLEPKLVDLAQDLEHRGQSAQVLGKSAESELMELGAELVKLAGELIHTLDLEQWRQREGAAHYLQGRMARDELRKINRSWNNDPVPEPRG